MFLKRLYLEIHLLRTLTNYPMFVEFEILDSQ